jgi:hypothetical protein
MIPLRSSAPDVAILLFSQVNGWVQSMTGRDFPNYVLFQLSNATCVLLCAIRVAVTD